MAVAAKRKRGRPRSEVVRPSDRRLMKPAVTGSPIYYRSTRGGSWKLDDKQLLFALDLYDAGWRVDEICEYFGISKYGLYRNISPYLERK